MKARALCALFVSACVTLSVQAESPPLVVHEWGTFTSFQDADGATIAGINVDDEPVPWFVHRLQRTGDRPGQPAGKVVAGRSELPSRSHDAPGNTGALFLSTLRLAGAAFDVQATFAGGWLTEFFPAATADRADFPKTLDAQARGSLLWKQVRLDPDAALLHDTTYRGLAGATKGHSTVVLNETKEAEKYLFYRGVGHLDAPIVGRGTARSTSRCATATRLDDLPRVWLVEVMPDGRVRYQALEPAGRSITARRLRRPPPE